MNSFSLLMQQYSFFPRHGLKGRRRKQLCDRLLAMRDSDEDRKHQEDYEALTQGPIVLSPEGGHRLQTLLKEKRIPLDDERKLQRD
jgi:hypothetical protein